MVVQVKPLNIQFKEIDGNSKPTQNSDTPTQQVELQDFSLKDNKHPFSGTANQKQTLNVFKLAK